MAFHQQLLNALALLLLTSITYYYSIYNFFSPHVIHLHDSEADAPHYRNEVVMAESSGVRMTESNVVEIAEKKVPELSKHDKSSVEPSNTPSLELPKHDKSSLEPSKNDKASLQTITHFFSHIPKAGGTFAYLEILRLFQSMVVYPNNRTEDDIRYAQQRFNQYYKNNTNGSDFFISTGDENWNNFPVDLEGATDAYTPSKLCQWGLARLNTIKPYQINIYKRKKLKKIRVKCNVVVTERPWQDVVTERPWQDDIENVYAIVRDPLSHVLSQYFHCTESSSHNYPISIDGQDINARDLMPSLDKWLETYIDLYDQSSSISQKELRTKIKKQTSRFQCYDPWNTESQWTGFDLPPNLPNNYTYPYPMDSKDIRDATTQSFDELLFNDLKSRFRLIGDVARMTKMVCAIFIDSYQGKHIPEVCDCTYTANSTRKNSSSTFCVPNRNVYPTGVRPNGTPDCSVTLGYKSSSHSHGVKHHGSSYLKTIGPETLELLHRVRYRDMILFNVTRAVFEKQIDEMEAQYKIRICDEYREPS